MQRQDPENEFVTKTPRHQRKKQQQQARTPADDEPVAATPTTDDQGISLRPRNMFATKGRTSNETAGPSAYRPQWSKSGDGFVSSKDANETADASRRKSKVLRYSKEELLAFHAPTSSPPDFPPDTVVVSQHSLPPVSSLPFDYEEIYKQWAANRNRGRGRGRGNGNERQNKWDDKNAKRDDEGKSWKRGDKPEDHEGDGNVEWDDVGSLGEGGGLDLMSMAEATEKFRQEMDAMRAEIAESTTRVPEGNLDEFDEKLENAAASGQFEDSDEDEPEAQWDDPIEPSPDAGLESLSAPLELPTQEQPKEQLLEQLPQPTAVQVEDVWFYMDPHGRQQGPFKTMDMREWFEAGYFKPHLPIRFGREGTFVPLANYFPQSERPFVSIPQPAPKRQERDPRDMELAAMLNLRPEMPQHHGPPQFQQQQDPMMHLSHEDKMRMDMQRLGLAQHAHLFQQQHPQHPQQQRPMPFPPQQQQHQHQHQHHMLLQHQNSWQQNQRDQAMPNMFPNNYRPDMPFPPANMPRQEVQEQPRQGVQEQPRQEPLEQSKHEVHVQEETNGVQPPKKEKSSEVETQPKKQPKEDKPAWTNSPAVEKKPSLKEIQEEEQKQRRQEMAQGQSNLADMGAHLKMMLGVQASSPEAQQPAQPEPKQEAPQPKQVTKQATPEPKPKQVSPKPKQAPQAQKQQIPTQKQPTPAQQKQSAPQAPKPSTPQTPKQPTPAEANQTPPAPAPAPSRPATSPWGATAAPSKPQSQKSMRDILAEEERIAQERAKSQQQQQGSGSHWMNVVAGVSNAPVPKANRQLGPVPVSVLKSRPQQKTQAQSSPPAPKKETDESFWNFGAAQTPKNESPSQGVGPFGSAELMAWCAKQLKNITGKDDLTLLEYCATLEDPGEIREYLAAYLGSTPRVSAFATEFIQRKKQVKNVKKDGKRSKRRSKGQRVDPSMLNYSVGS